MKLKSILKTIKLNESSISMFLGLVVVVVVGYLVINYFQDQDSGDTLPTGGSIETEGPTITKDGKTFHKVQDEDTLWEIAEFYYDSGYNWVDIASTNNISNPNIIEEGQELEIPDVEPKQATVSVVESSDTKVLSAISGASYTVQKGDNLWEIAVRAYGDGYRWTDIAKENSLDNPGIIHPGNKLSLPR